MSSDDRVALNIGGTRFEVPRRTLARFPESLLGSLATPDAPSELECEPNGEYFFDRNGRFFEFVLEYYRSGAIHPPSDLTPQQVLNELQFWRLNEEPYLEMIAEESRIRNYVEPPVETPLEQLDPQDLLDHLASLSPADRLRADTQFVHHEDLDLVKVALADLKLFLDTLEADQELVGSPIHVDILSMLSLGHYRLGQIRSSREYVNRTLLIDQDHKQARDLQTLLNDSSAHFTRLGILALGLVLVGGAAFKVWRWSSSKKSQSS